MGVAGRFFAQLFGTTLCDFGAIMRWWLPACSGSSSAPGYLLPFLSPGIPIPGLSVCALPGCLFWDLAGGGRWGCTHGCSSGVLQGHTFLLLMQATTVGSWAGDYGFALGSGDMQSVHPPLGMAAPGYPLPGSD